MFAPYNQTSFETFFGIDGLGQVAYSPTVTGGPLSSGDSVWFHDTPVAVEGEPSSVAGQFWRFASRPTSTDDGIPFFVGGLTSTSGGSTQSYIFAKGLGGTSLVRGGDVVPNVPNPISTGSISFDYGVSALGNHWMILAPMSGATSTTDGVVIYDGSGLLLGGSLVREGQPLPAAIGGLVGENWQNFGFKACNEAGDWLLEGDSSVTPNDGFLVHNGTIRYREGDVIDGATTVNTIQAAVMNESGTIAYTWEIVTGLGNREAIFLEDELLLVEGQQVDLDGDGTVEANSILVDVGGVQTLGLSASGELYFLGDVDVNGTSSTTDDITALFKFDLTLPPTAYCTAGTTTNLCNATITASANPSVSFANACTLSVNNVEGQKNGIVFYGLTPAAIPWAMGSESFLCVKTPTQRTGTQTSGGTLDMCDGSFTLDWNAYQTGNPTALGNPWAVGNKAYVQAWFRDPPAVKTTNLSDAVEITYVP
jgi:hypothetical protein